MITQKEINDLLVKWVVGTIEPWEQHRDQNYSEKWKEYYKEWKSIWTHDSKTRDSERSRFISPALGQAIEMAVSEMEEATFSRKYWVDLEDDIVDPVKTDMQLMRNQLIEDFNLAKVPKAIVETYLNGAIYGTGIGKVIVEEIEEIVIEDGLPTTKPRIQVSLDPVSPRNFAIDPSARTVNEGLGCAHIQVKPKIDILMKQREGIYEDVDLGDYVDDEDVTEFGEVKSRIVGSQTEIIEYHGLVPDVFLMNPEDELEEDFLEDIYDPDEAEMIEAIVTISNRQSLLKKVKNPFLMNDRSFIAYQHDTVPNRFWGRGVAEKGMHPQRALNAELRARQDGLALTIHPMMGVDGTRIPRGMKLEVAPGKSVITNGDPRSVLYPMHFGDMSQHTYAEAGELERMLQMGTGSMDTATPIGVSPRNQTASGMSMIAAGSIKRNKRTMRNIEVDFLIPLINKTLWRYQQFDSQRYPYGDYKLIPYSTMGIMAREFEQGQLAQAMQTTNDIPQMKAILLKAFIENSSINVGNELNVVMEQIMNPQPDPMQQFLQQLQVQNAQLMNEKLKKEVGKIESETVENLANARSKVGQTEVNKFNAIAQVQENELDRQAFGNK